jgi:polysaccharide export outer membrane protein
MGGFKSFKIGFWATLCFVIFGAFFVSLHAIPPYVLGPDDVIELYAVDSQKEDILNSPSDTNALYQTYEKYGVATNAHQFKVDAEGKLYLPYIGFVSVKGKTLKQFSAEVTSRLAKHVDRPEVRVKVIEPKKISVFVFGDVGEQGVFTLTDHPSETSVFNLLKLARGYKTTNQNSNFLDQARVTSVSIARKKNSKQWELVALDMTKLSADMTDNDDLYLRDGDRVVVSFSSDKIYVIGQVLRPGSYPYSSNATLAQYIADSGGMTNQAGDEIVISPGYAKNEDELVKVKLDKRLVETEAKVKPLLKPGTIIYVTRSLDLWRDITDTLLLLRNTMAFSVDVLDSNNAIRVGGSNRTLLNF